MRLGRWYFLEHFESTGMTQECFSRRNNSITIFVIWNAFFFVLANDDVRAVIVNFLHSNKCVIILPTRVSYRIRVNRQGPWARQCFVVYLMLMSCNTRIQHPCHRKTLPSDIPALEAPWTVIHGDIWDHRSHENTRGRQPHRDLKPVIKLFC